MSELHSHVHLCWHPKHLWEWTRIFCHLLKVHRHSLQNWNNPEKRREQWCVCGREGGWVEGWIMHISCNFLWISSSFYCSGMKWNQHLSAKRKRKEKHNSICLSSSCHCPVHTQSATFDQTYVHRTCETTGNKQALQKQCYVKPRCVIKPTIRLR